ncbi:MAG TPA: helix-turn-helix transcriptional regulator [Sphingobacteriaceae bacterium]|nr:helix-turn-helix transcriptional regulator [Sphingobacteriaceae bacterium]
MIKNSDKEALKKFGQNLRKLRDAQKLSLRDVSISCNIDNSKISKIEQGQINITFTTLLELAKGLNVEPSELMKF